MFNVYVQVQRFGITNDYLTDDNVRMSVRQLMALGFAPLLRVRTVFTQIEMNGPIVLQPLFNYFRNEWLTVLSPNMWNVFDAEDHLRSNNHLEGWHAGFNKTVTKHHPNIWRFLEAIINEQAYIDVTIQQINTGQVQCTVKPL